MVLLGEQGTFRKTASFRALVPYTRWAEHGGALFQLMCEKRLELELFQEVLSNDELLKVCMFMFCTHTHTHTHKHTSTRQGA
jgi:hypothetical protein